LRTDRKPEKLLFDNTNIFHAYADEFGIEVNKRTLRETFFASCFSDLFYSDIGDFRVKNVDLYFSATIDKTNFLSGF